MIFLKKTVLIPLGVLILGVQAGASMVDQLVYNVAGQVTNAIGSRLGDEIYYGGSGRHHVVHRHHRVHRRIHHVKRHVVTSHRLTDQQKIQKALASLGFYHGAIDGEINSFESRSAIKALNSAYGIGNTASLSREERDALVFLGTLFGFDRHLVSGNNSDRAKSEKIQTALKVEGFYHGSIDGAMGPGSRRAILEYKTRNTLSSGSSLDFEEEYQLVSSAKAKNDALLQDIINSLHYMGRQSGQTRHYAQQQTYGPGNSYTPTQSSGQSSGYIPAAAGRAAPERGSASTQSYHQERGAMQEKNRMQERDVTAGSTSSRRGSYRSGAAVDTPARSTETYQPRAGTERGALQ